MFAKQKKIYSIIHQKCPHCHEGEFFVTRNPFDLSKVGDVLPNCSVCKRKYESEPGFYFGALYVSYGLAVGLCIAIFVAVYVLAPDTDATTTVWWVLGGLLLSAPILYAWSKILWANMFITYKGVEPVPGEDLRWLPR
ncbi:MAG: DUF983 domain-containing protein [Flavobacteriales bacterium]|nr:DUF983 domain-containing protein [Flavobacteriales bacterium]MBP6641861.1 DUF983 domain-containing protein [Flavobacteriales bacterium]MBP7155249.1 DUF983 domain-containing protein [Flavobacteriales bacterium]HQV74812.1 DUF983 domain-containing protein [Flavobacteriales bacterium]HQW40131.1 DUF983 domain-containing protein [Flavobacteriales bacterium]